MYVYIYIYEKLLRICITEFSFDQILQRNSNNDIRMLISIMSNSTMK